MWPLGDSAIKSIFQPSLEMQLTAFIMSFSALPISFFQPSLEMQLAKTMHNFRNFLISSFNLLLKCNMSLSWRVWSPFISIFQPSLEMQHFNVYLAALADLLVLSTFSWNATSIFHPFRLRLDLNFQPSLEMQRKGKPWHPCHGNMPFNLLLKCNNWSKSHSRSIRQSFQPSLEMQQGGKQAPELGQHVYFQPSLEMQQANS